MKRLGNMVLVALFLLAFIACRKGEFAENPSINHSVEKAIDVNMGAYTAGGSINNTRIDNLDLQLSKAQYNKINISSSQFPTFTFEVNNLTTYPTHSVPGGEGSNLISATNGIQFSIVGGIIQLKFDNSNVKIDVVGSKLP
jgi:hypothetical protein